MLARKPKPKNPSLRYFARFKADFGHLHAVVRYDKIRRGLLTPIVVTKEQLARLDTAGHVRPVTSMADAKVEQQLQEFTAVVWQVFTPLLASGKFENMRGEEITALVVRELNRRNAGKEGSNGK